MHNTLNGLTKHFMQNSHLHDNNLRPELKQPMAHMGWEEHFESVAKQDRTRALTCFVASSKRGESPV